MRAVRIAIILVAAILAACASERFVVRGQEKSCYSISDLDRALSISDASYFNGWSASDYDAAAAWSAGCVSSGWQFAGSTRIARLRSLQAKMKRIQEHEAYVAAAPQRQIEERARKEAQERMAEEQRQKAEADAIARQVEIDAWKKEQEQELRQQMEWKQAEIKKLKGKKYPAHTTDETCWRTNRSTGARFRIC